MTKRTSFDVEKEENISDSSWPKKLKQQYALEIDKQAKQFAFRIEKIKALLQAAFDESFITQSDYQQVLSQIEHVFDKNLEFLKTQLKVQTHLAKTEGTATVYLLDEKLKENEQIVKKLDILLDKLALIELENDQNDVTDELDRLIEHTRLYKSAKDEFDY